MWCRPDPSSVSPMYMPGRLRTASSPFSTLMDSAPYSACPLDSEPLVSFSSLMLRPVGAAYGFERPRGPRARPPSAPRAPARAYAGTTKYLYREAGLILHLLARPRRSAPGQLRKPPAFHPNALCALGEVLE